VVTVSYVLDIWAPHTWVPPLRLQGEHHEDAVTLLNAYARRRALTVERRDVRCTVETVRFDDGTVAEIWEAAA
jgi:hypothetical protein